MKRKLFGVALAAAAIALAYASGSYLALLAVGVAYVLGTMDGSA